MKRILSKLVRKAEFLRGTAASEIAEAALVLPLAFMMLLGIYWFGRAFNVYATINHAAREGARAAAAPTCASCTNQPPDAAHVAAIVTQALQASSISPTQIQVYQPPQQNGAQCTATCDSSNSNITVCTNLQLTPVGSAYPPVCGVSVSFQYPYQMSLPFTSLNQQQFLLKANVQMKGEY